MFVGFANVFELLIFLSFASLFFALRVWPDGPGLLCACTKEYDAVWGSPPVLPWTFELVSRILFSSPRPSLLSRFMQHSRIGFTDHEAAVPLRRIDFSVLTSIESVSSNPV